MTAIRRCGPNPAAELPAVSGPPPVAGGYQGQIVALLTQHGKEQVIAPVLEPALGCRIECVSGYDTDLLGTFTRDIRRAGTQLDAARRKARVGMQLAGRPLGLASEGSFGPDPMLGVFPWNVGLLVWIDDVHGLEAVGRAQGKANFAHLLARMPVLRLPLGSGSGGLSARSLGRCVVCPKD